GAAGGGAAVATVVDSAFATDASLFACVGAFAAGVATGAGGSASTCPRRDSRAGDTAPDLSCLSKKGSAGFVSCATAGVSAFRDVATIAGLLFNCPRRNTVRPITATTTSPNAGTA